MKAKITAFIHDLIMYDYILFATVFVLFILFIIIGILLRKKLFLAVVFIFLAFGVLLAGPTVGYIKMHEYLFKNTTTLITQKRLVFVPAVVVKGELTNNSKRDFKSCRVTASAYRFSKNALKIYLYKLKPFKKMSIIKYNILKGQTVDFKIIVEPFTYKRDYNISLGANCR